MTNALHSQVNENEITSKNSKGKAELINFKETKINSDDLSVKDFFAKQFLSKSETEFQSDSKSSKTENKLESKKYQQFYKEIKVEFGIQNVVAENGVLRTVNGRYVDIQNLETKPKLTQKEAMEFALKSVGIKEYIWEKKESELFLKKEQNNPDATFYPKGELLIVEKYLFTENPIPTLVYKFDIYASYPVSRDYIYVDANNGEIILKDAIIKHIQGIADTRYSGQRTIETQQSGTQYKLRDYSRGNGIETYNMNRGTDFSSATDFIDNDNNWISTEYNNTNKDNVALDAHWGAGKTYDYFLGKHNRNSYNGSGAVIRNYAHYGNAYENAAWDGQRMIYGDGGSRFTPLTSIDVVAHEIGHAVCSSTANLVYSSESGAINEGLSDIWGAMIEYFADPTKQTYLIGEEIKIGGGAIRSMSNPKSLGQPDTYGGINWVNPNCGKPTRENNFCGVHTNSGVLNHWFYILAEGKSGTNDIGNANNVNGIGKEKAAKIAYRAESVYFNATSNYSQARDLTIQAAKDLYGTNSVESAIVCQSWYAVGVGNNNCDVSVAIIGDNVICSPTTDYTYTVSNLTPGAVVNWDISTNSLVLVSSNNSSITVKPINSTYNGDATITASVSGSITTKTIWIGKPLLPDTIIGPSNVLTGALVNYSAGTSEGSTSYEWWLPYVYDTVTTFDYYGDRWQKLTNFSSSSTIQVFTGYGQISGLVQVMGKNICGCGGAKTIQVSHSSSDGDPAGGNIPFNGIGISNLILDDVLIYPNPANQLLNIRLPKNAFEVSIYDINGVMIFNNNTLLDNLAIDTNLLLAGNYILIITQENKSLSKKIIIKH